jgi:excisionase family DNA binding protein
MFMPIEIAPRKKASAAFSVNPKDKLLVSLDEAAQLLSISRRSIEYLVATNKLSTRRIGTRALIPVEDLRGLHVRTTRNAWRVNGYFEGRLVLPELVLTDSSKWR